MKIFSSLDNIAAPDFQPGQFLIWPDSCWLLSERPLFVPDFEDSFYAVAALAGKIGRIGKTIAPRFGHRYVSEVTAALIILPGSVRAKLSESQLPSAADLCFDNALVIGDWQRVNLSSDARLILNFKQTFQSSEAVVEEECMASPDLLYSSIAEMSKKNTMKMGDIVLYPLPSSTRKINEGDTFTIEVCNLSDRPLLTTRFK